MILKANQYIDIKNNENTCFLMRTKEEKTGLIKEVLEYGFYLVETDFGDFIIHESDIN